MAPGPLQLLLVAILVLIVFGGRGKISAIMGDVAKGITSFRQGLKEPVEDVKNSVDDAIDVTPPKDKQ